MPDSTAERAVPYLARIIQEHLLEDPDGRTWTREGTAAQLDISGFTALSEQLARKGREGAEQISEVIGNSFESILKVAYENGASLLKFGGDALLLWFQGEGHAERGCRATVLMRVECYTRSQASARELGCRAARSGVHAATESRRRRHGAA